MTMQFVLRRSQLCGQNRVQIRGTQKHSRLGSLNAKTWQHWDLRFVFILDYPAGIFILGGR